MKTAYFHFLFLVWILIGTLPAQAEILSGHEQVKAFLVRFHQDPKFAMNSITTDGFEPFIPKKFDVGNQFNDISRDFKKMFMTDYSFYSAPAENDRVENLVEGTIVRNLLELDKMGLKKSQLDTMPWSDSYWPMARGLIGNRYADPNFPEGYSWAANRAYISSRPAWSEFASGNGLNLSPAEKYDLLVGDSNTTLTNSVWSKGQYYYDTYGMVESWMGLCHGWAPASFMYPQPMKAVDVQSANGRTIRFFPSDIKALASLEWGATQVQPKFVGVKCKSRYPEYDEVGRIINDTCVDSNPGTWHMGVVNQVGALKRGLVMDATYNYEVWNHAIYGYDYVYFNPQTLEPTKIFSKAAIPVSRFAIDKFRKYRSPDAATIVGVSMNLTYIIPIRSSHSESQSNLSKTVNFIYDLELNAAGEIVGGEWYTNLHPDFLWTPAVGSRAVSIADGEINPAEWDLSTPLPASWMRAAGTASHRGQPLAAIVERLVESAKAVNVQP